MRRTNTKEKICLHRTCVGALLQGVIQYAPLGITDCLKRESLEAHSPVHGTVEAAMAIGLEGSTVAKVNLKRDDREAEIVANIGAKEAAEDQGLMTPEPL